MKRILVIGWFVLFCISHGFGAPVTGKDIRNVVESFVVSVFPPGHDIQIAGIVPVANGSDVYLYAVNLKPGGWVLVSGDDKTVPILGYSFSGSFDPAISSEEGVRDLIRHYSDAIASAAQDNTFKRNALWNGSPQSFALKSTSITTVEPMIKVTWNQDKNWNILCPADAAGPGGHTYVGCVGVCMAQAMSYYHYPVQATGSKTYYNSTYGTIVVHYDREAPYQWDSMALNVADKFNSRLLYHCAVSVQMDFGADGSSAQTRNVSSALVNYFKYFKGAKYVARYDNDTTWTSLLISELSAGRPVIYSGFPEDNSPGHAFDIDGVDMRGYFHLNWGWSGQYNAYYLINNLRPGTLSFTRDQGAIINIRPPVYYPTDLDLTKSNVKEHMPAGTYVGRLKITDEAPDNVYSFTLKGDSLGIDNYLPADFYLSHDTLRTNREFLYIERSEYPLYIKVEDQFGHIYNEKFTISILENSIPSGISLTPGDNIIIYPNPTSGKIYIQSADNGPVSVVVTDQLGRVVFRQECNDNNKIHELDHPYPGLYFVNITDMHGNRVLRKITVY